MKSKIEDHNKLFYEALETPAKITGKELANVIHNCLYPQNPTGHQVYHSCCCSIMALQILGFQDILDKVWPEKSNEQKTSKE